MLFLPLFVSLVHLLFGVDEAEIVFAGDAMQHQAQLNSAKVVGGGYDYTGCFDAIAPLIQSADYAVVNLETPIGGNNFSGYPCFNAPASFAHALREAGFNLMLTANNHTLDRRDRGLHATIDSLDAAGIEHIGTYHNSAARDTVLPFVKNIAGIRVGFLNYTYGTNGISVSGDAVVDYIDRGKITEDIDAVRKAEAEIVCVAVHWGDEYHLLENASQRSLADFLVDNGVDLIIGGHPHVIQPMEVRHNDELDKDVLVVYSLGNFISNMKTRDTRGGAIVRVRLVRGRDGVARFDSAAYDLVFTVPPTDASENYRLVPVDECTGRWGDACKAFVSSAEKIFKGHNIGVGRVSR
ncbi:MAG: CapA family protein [Muribaculaceae bacterium]|nr:CapA family protein [Muribaculaceae bacterium]